MIPVWPVVLLFADAAQVTAASPPSQTPEAQVAPPKAASTVSPAAVPECPQPSGDSQTIVICTQRPQGYRLNPDVMEAKRETKNSSRPVRPGGTIVPDCTNVGPAPCVTAGVNLIGAALTAAQMAERIAKGEEVGSMFATDPHPSEYQLYLIAKARREAEKAQEAALAKEKAARAAQDAVRTGNQPQSPDSSQH
jgi:hypothetical protein